MQVELRDIQRKLGVTTLFVTHDQSEALSMSDRVAVMSQGRIRQLGTPADVYRRPSDRFVASFVGDANILRGRLEQIDGSSAVVSLGAARVTVPSAPLVDLALLSPVDLFVRPEQLKIADVSEPCATSGTVTAQVYQGGHADIYVASEASSRDLLVRTGEHDALSRWRVGTKVGVLISASDGVAFATIGDVR
jgi:ABC-type Fe3+/spermidine/putrescine transport system ATPase subunit